MNPGVGEHFIVWKGKECTDTHGGARANEMQGNSGIQIMSSSQTVRRINWTPTHVCKHTLGMLATNVGVCSCTCTHTDVCYWTGGELTASSINLHCVSLNMCVCGGGPRWSHVMYVKVAASRQFQVDLITKVIPLEQQFCNGMRW